LSYTPPLGAILPAGTRTLQVAFTPFDAATYSTQTMTMSITVDRAPLSVVANHQTAIYGSPEPGRSFVATGFQNGDTEATALSGGLSRAAGSNVGSYAIGIGTLAATDNYSLAFTGSALDITPASLTITAGSDTKVYGTPFTASSFTAAGLLNADGVDSVTLTSAGEAAGAAVGSYDIVPSAALGSGLGNYAITYVNGALTVTPASLSVIADPQTKVAGSIDPPLTFTATGFQAGDTSAVLTGSLARAGGEAPGTYAITQGTLAAGGNYSIAFTGSTLTITAPPPPPPPPAGIAIAPIPPQTNTDGDEVDLQVVVVAPATATHKLRGRAEDDRAEPELRGVFTIAGLNGLKIDKDGEISGHIRAGVTQVTTFDVIVTYTQDGVTATQHIAWTVKPAPRKGGKG
jgi:hypothetical protein